MFHVCFSIVCFTVDSKHDDKGSKKAKEKHQKVTSGSVKPLTGKIFYLDLPSNKRNETLENDIQTLGGVCICSCV